MKPVRNFLASLIDPVLAPRRTYEVDFQSGVTPHLSVSTDTLLLHLVADTGDKWKKLRSREELRVFIHEAVRVDLA